MIEYDFAQLGDDEIKTAVVIAYTENEAVKWLNANPYTDPNIHSVKEYDIIYISKEIETEADKPYMEAMETLRYHHIDDDY